jgi:hypothetical protein
MENYLVLNYEPTKVAKIFKTTNTRRHVEVLYHSTPNLSKTYSFNAREITVWRLDLKIFMYYRCSE